MTLSSVASATTLIEGLKISLGRAGHFDSGDTVAPAAILWTDTDGQWQVVVNQLQSLMPNIYTLGEYNPQEKTGPAIWLRCIIDRTLPDSLILEGEIPIIYMPNVSRQTLRAVEECPDSLKPLVELQFRGVLWIQRNGKDWTVEAFLMSDDGGLGLDVAQDKQTRNAMLGALSQLSMTSLSRLRGKHLEAEDFDKLMIEDTPRDLLMWLSSPAQIKEKWDDVRWNAFCSRCKSEFDFDPEHDGDIMGGEKLGRRDGVWNAAWDRFVESPQLYPGIPGLLRRARPQEILFVKETWPDENENEETTLREELLKIEQLNQTDARKKIIELENHHGERRGWVWSRLDLCPLAHAIGHLSILAKKTEQALGGFSLESLAAQYMENGTIVDDAVLKTLATVKAVNDIKAVLLPIKVLYLPWVDDAARVLQNLLKAAGGFLVKKEDAPVVEAFPGQCLLFVDSLRYDVGLRLLCFAESRGLHAEKSRHWTALPSVTPTAKPAVSPIANEIVGSGNTPDFVPIFSDTGDSVTPDRFKKALNKKGYQILSAHETGSPYQQDAKGWSEFGEFDKEGHTLQSKLAGRIDDQIELLTDRVSSLLSAGWNSVRLVTDHGWLLMPGGLPVVKLPKYLTEIRWSRCAAVKETSQTEIPIAQWYWNSSAQIGFGPGVSCFTAGNEYAHGGVSLQECLVPDITFKADSASLPLNARITDGQWLGMRCRIIVENGAQLTAEIRTKPGDPATIIEGTRKGIDSEGRAGLLVEDDGLVGVSVSVVVTDHSGQVIAKHPTIIGGE
jgi:hypothetical protein